MPAASVQTVRRYALTASVAAITATGAWYGAGLKSQQEFAQERQEVLQATPSERIQQLETARAKLVKQRDELQGKIDRLGGQAADPYTESVQHDG